MCNITKNKWTEQNQVNDSTKTTFPPKWCNVSSLQCEPSERVQLQLGNKWAFTPRRADVYRGRIIGDINQRHTSPPLGHISPLRQDDGTTDDNSINGFTWMLWVAAASLKSAWQRKLGPLRRASIGGRKISISDERTAESLGFSQWFAGLVYWPEQQISALTNWNCGSVMELNCLVLRHAALQQWTGRITVSWFHDSSTKWKLTEIFVSVRNDMAKHKLHFHYS